MTQDSPISKTSAFRVERYVWAVLGVWTVVVAASLAWNAVQLGRETLELARLQARVGYGKDVIYRRWNTTRGPVYVAQTAETPPNPYLSDMPERDITTPLRRRLTMMNPAYMTRQVHEMAEEETGVRGHITSLKPIRPKNAADPWEGEALRAIEAGRDEVSGVENMDGRSYMRLMRPLFTEPGCLKCHAKQDYQVGDIRGGISVSVPMEPLRAVEHRQMVALTLGHGAVWLIGAVGVLVGGQRLRAQRDAIEEKNEQLAQRGRELEQAYLQLDREFKSVGDMQISLLPAQLPEIRGFEGVTHYRPARRAGGDYFDLLALDDDQWGVLVADVSGHGAPAAVVMAMTHVMVHLRDRKIPPDDVLVYLNETLDRHIGPEQFVTCCYGILDTRAHTFTFAAAGHPAPLLFDPSTGRAEPCAVEVGYPLGIGEEAQYSLSTVRLAPGQVLLLYTDGIIEAIDADGRMFGLQRLAAALAAHARDGAAQARKAILAALDEHRGRVELGDDTTLVILRVLENAPTERDSGS